MLCCYLWLMMGLLCRLKQCVCLICRYLRLFFSSVRLCRTGKERSRCHFHHASYVIFELSFELLLRIVDTHMTLGTSHNVNNYVYLKLIVLFTSVLINYLHHAKYNFIIKLSLDVSSVFSVSNLFIFSKFEWRLRVLKVCNCHTVIPNLRVCFTEFVHTSTR